MLEVVDAGVEYEAGVLQVDAGDLFAAGVVFTDEHDVFAFAVDGEVACHCEGVEDGALFVVHCVLAGAVDLAKYRYFVVLEPYVNDGDFGDIGGVDGVADLVLRLYACEAEQVDAAYYGVVYVALFVYYVGLEFCSLYCGCDLAGHCAAGVGAEVEGGSCFGHCGVDRYCEYILGHDLGFVDGGVLLHFVEGDLLGIEHVGDVAGAAAGCHCECDCGCEGEFACSRYC